MWASQKHITPCLPYLLTFCEIKWSNYHFLNYRGLIRFGNLLIKTKDKELEKGHFILVNGKTTNNQKRYKKGGNEND